MSDNRLNGSMQSLRITGKVGINNHFNWSHNRDGDVRVSMLLTLILDPDFRSITVTSHKRRGVSNRRRLCYLFNNVLMLTTKGTSLGLCEWNPQAIGLELMSLKFDRRLRILATFDATSEKHRQHDDISVLQPVFCHYTKCARGFILALH